MLDGYQKIVNKYLEKHTKGNSSESEKFYWKSDFLSEEDWTRLCAIYVQMTNTQKEEQMIGFVRDPLPMPILANMSFPPPQGWYDRWIEDKKCIIWIDGEKVDKSALNDYKRDDFVMYHASTLFRSGGRIDEYRVDLWTETGFKTFYEPSYDQPVSMDKLLEIETRVFFRVEKEGKNNISLHFAADPINGWMKLDSTIRGYSNTTQTPSTYHPK